MSRKFISNALFVLLIVVMILPGTRSWLIRQVSFSPSIVAKDERKLVDNYNWSLKGVNTGDINFNELKGEVVLVNFWATWCPSCRAEKPSLANLYNEYKDKVTFLFVSNEEKGAIEKYYQKKNYKMPTYHSLTQPPSQIKGNSIPATYVFGKNQQIAIAKVGAADWDTDKVRKLLDELIAE